MVRLTEEHRLLFRLLKVFLKGKGFKKIYPQKAGISELLQIREGFDYSPIFPLGSRKTIKGAQGVKELGRDRLGLKEYQNYYIEILPHYYNDDYLKSSIDDYLNPFFKYLKKGDFFAVALVNPELQEDEELQRKFAGYGFGVLHVDKENEMIIEVIPPRPFLSPIETVLENPQIRFSYEIIKEQASPEITEKMEFILREALANQREQIMGVIQQDRKERKWQSLLDEIGVGFFIGGGLSLIITSLAPILHLMGYPHLALLFQNSLFIGIILVVLGILIFLIRVKRKWA